MRPNAPRDPASVPHPALGPDASRRPRSGAALPAPHRSVLTSAPALTRGPCVWRCDFAARRLGWPWGSGRAGPAGPRPGRKEGGPCGPLLAPALGPRRSACSARLAPSPLSRSPTRLSEPSRGRGRRPGARGAGGAGTRPWPRTGRASLVSADAAGKCDLLRTGRASGRAGERRAGGEGKREQEEKSSRAAWLRSPAAPGARWAVRAATAPSGGLRAPLRVPQPARGPGGRGPFLGIPVEPQGLSQPRRDLWLGGGWNLGRRI